MESFIPVDDSPVDLRCSVIVLRANAVLLIHRQSRERPDWVLPGGRPKGSESTSACARREVAEETGLDVNPERCAFVFEVTDPLRHSRTLELVFLGQLLSDGDMLSGEPGNEPTWVPLSRLSQIRLRPPIGGYVGGLARNIHGTAAYLGNMWRPSDDIAERV